MTSKARQIRTRPPVGGGVPTPRQQQRDSHKPWAHSQPSIVGKGLALSVQHTVRCGKPWANPLSGCEFAQGWRVSDVPYREMLRIRPKLRKTWALRRGAPGPARPTGVNADSPDGLLRFRAAARNAGDGVPYRGMLHIRRTWRFDFGAAARAGAKKIQIHFCRGKAPAKILLVERLCPPMRVAIAQRSPLECRTRRSGPASK